ncbi:hypothetical protein AcW2_005645 [Taiwanofungus camphoratus]|nr:hypothetical protein AcW2_005645 [Antrodia cinnamomea]
MDQESFRKLLQTPKPSSSTSTPRGSLLSTASTKSAQKPVKSTQPAFRPRTVKKPAGPYRDRAAERRLGLDNEYAQVEALADAFERRNAENADRKAVEEQRRYLGGDSEHSVLVRGLDYALFEQNRARLAVSTATEEDESLEAAFHDASSGVPRKRTREEIVQELKNKRAKSGESSTGGDEAAVSADTGKTISNADLALEEAKKAGKFRPIGFKPIGSTGEVTKKVKQKEGGKSKRKKKHPADLKPIETSEVPLPSTTTEATAPKSSVIEPPAIEPEPEQFEENFDIFADAGEYTGIDLGDDEDLEGNDEGEKVLEDEIEDAPPTGGKWFATEEAGRDSSPAPGALPPAPANSAQSKSSRSPPPVQGRSPPQILAREEDQEEDEVPMRLQPLASSALPSIRDLLAMDSAADKVDKRRARKEKNKDKRGAGDGKVDKNKLDRDYQRLKAYTDKKAAGGG